MRFVHFGLAPSFGLCSHEPFLCQSRLRMLTRGPSRITFGARNVEFFSQLILTNPYEVRLTDLSGYKEFYNRKPECNGFILSIIWL